MGLQKVCVARIFDENLSLLIFGLLSFFQELGIDRCVSLLLIHISFR